MKCEICHKHDAEVAVRRVVDGVEKELYVCNDCAQDKKKASGEKSPVKSKTISINASDPAQLITGLLKQIIDAGIENVSSLDNPVAQSFGSPCPACGLTAVDFKRNSRLGCPECYAHFAKELAPVIRDMQPGATHVGKMPSEGGAPSKEGEK